MGAPDGPGENIGLSAQAIGLADLTAEYLVRDLHAEGVWESSSHARYGTVVFNASSQVLLREPTNHFGGFVWTFAKGGPHGDERPVETALRETLEETGYRPAIVGHLPAAFRGGSMSSVNFFFLGFDFTGPVNMTAADGNRETSALTWVHEAEARDLIAQSTDIGGRDRDLRTLKAAFREFSAMVAAAGQGTSATDRDR